MQRLLSLATLGVLGSLGWIFVQGGGLNQIAIAPQGQQQQPAGYQTPGPWQAPSSSPVGSSFPSGAPEQQQPYRQASTSPSAPRQQFGGGETIRIASFNIQVFGNTKASKPYVMQELADIVNQFDVVAIQEIRSKDEYLIPNFVQLVNQRGRRFDHVIGPRIGITTSKEQYVYLFDTQRVEVDHQSVYTVSDPDGLLHREPLVATFRTRGVDPDQAFTFTLINVHTDPDIADQEMDVLGEVYRVVRRSSRGEDDIILLGDFNVDDRHLGRLGQLPGILPLIAGVWTNTRQNRQYDNLIIHGPSTTEYSGRSGVFDFMRFKNLSLQQALQVSDHFPVWAEFSVYERDYAGRIASRRQQAGR
ncbi:MAG: endonuclease/exonuclease/phosphatase family protein [Bythopirellula sp.]